MKNNKLLKAVAPATALLLLFYGNSYVKADLITSIDNLDFRVKPIYAGEDSVNRKDLFGSIYNGSYLKSCTFRKLGKTSVYKGKFQRGETYICDMEFDAWDGQYGFHTKTKATAIPAGNFDIFESDGKTLVSYDKPLESELNDDTNLVVSFALKAEEAAVPFGEIKAFRESKLPAVGDNWNIMQSIDYKTYQNVYFTGYLVNKEALDNRLDLEYKGDKTTKDVYFSGKIEDNKDYYMYLRYAADPGFYLTDSTKIILDNTETKFNPYNNKTGYKILKISYRNGVASVSPADEYGLKVTVKDSIDFRVNGICEGEDSVNRRDVYSGIYNGYRIGKTTFREIGESKVFEGSFEKDKLYECTMEILPDGRKFTEDTEVYIGSMTTEIFDRDGKSIHDYMLPVWSDLEDDGKLVVKFGLKAGERKSILSSFSLTSPDLTELIGQEWNGKRTFALNGKSGHASAMLLTRDAVIYHKYTDILNADKSIYYSGKIEDNKTYYAYVEVRLDPGNIFAEKYGIKIDDEAVAINEFNNKSGYLIMEISFNNGKVSRKIYPREYSYYSENKMGYVNPASIHAGEDTTYRLDIIGGDIPGYYECDVVWFDLESNKTFEGVFEKGKTYGCEVIYAPLNDEIDSAPSTYIVNGYDLDGVTPLVGRVPVKVYKDGRYISVKFALKAEESLNYLKSYDLEFKGLPKVGDEVDRYTGMTLGDKEGLGVMGRVKIIKDSYNASDISFYGIYDSDCVYKGKIENGKIYTLVGNVVLPGDSYQNKDTAVTLEGKKVNAFLNNSVGSFVIKLKYENGKPSLISSVPESYMKSPRRIVKPTDTPVPTATSVPTATPTAVPTEAPAATATPAPSVTEAPAATATATPVPTAVVTAAETPAPTETPVPTVVKQAVVKGNTYKVSGDDKAVFTKAAKSSKINIPASVKIDGKKYKVTAIQNGAFKNNKKLTKIVIGKNVTKIGRNAFAGCRNVKTVMFKSKTVTSVGKNAFKGISSKAKFTFSGNAEKIKKLIRKSGYKNI